MIILQKELGKTSLKLLTASVFIGSTLMLTACGGSSSNEDSKADPVNPPVVPVTPVTPTVDPEVQALLNSESLQLDVTKTGVALIGKNDTQLLAHADLANKSVSLSTDESCAFKTECAQQVSLPFYAGISSTTDKLKINSKDDSLVYKLDGDEHYKTTNVAEALDGGRFAARSYSQVVELGGNLLSIGGYTGKAGKNRTDIWSSDDGVEWNKIAQEPAGIDNFASLWGYQVVNLKGTLYLIGGAYGSNEQKKQGNMQALPGSYVQNTVYKSTDGVNWEKLSGVNLEARALHKAVVFNDEIYVVGGRGENNKTTEINKVVKSADGVNWTVVNAPESLISREDAGVAVHEGNIWVYGGIKRQMGIHMNNQWENLNDIWYFDGTNWNQAVKDSVDVDAGNDDKSYNRTGHQLISFNGKLLSIAGEVAFGTIQADGSVSDHILTEKVSYYDNGYFKAFETDQEMFSPRMGHQAVVFKDKLLVTSGYDGSRKNDVWTSVDGKDWNEITDPLKTNDLAPVAGQQMIAFNDRIWSIAGQNSEKKFSNTVFTSLDGVNFRRVNKAPFVARHSHQAVEFKGKVFVIGGVKDKDNFLNDVWSTTNGVKWTQEAVNAEFAERYGHQVVAYKDALYLIGGSTKATGATNDIWKSVDGVKWEKVTDSASFPARFGHRVVEFKDALYLVGGFGGNEGAKRLSDVWKSTDGINWTPVKSSDASAFSARGDHQLVVNNNQMLIIGGNAQDPYNSVGSKYLNDVWSSNDGATWSKVTNADFSGRDGHQVINFKDSLWLVGGTRKEGSSEYVRNDEVWKSDDNGQTWRQAVRLDMLFR